MKSTHSRIWLLVVQLTQKLFTFVNNSGNPINFPTKTYFPTPMPMSSLTTFNQTQASLNAKFTKPWSTSNDATFPGTCISCPSTFSDTPIYILIPKTFNGNPLYSPHEMIFSHSLWSIIWLKYIVLLPQCVTRCPFSALDLCFNLGLMFGSSTPYNDTDIIM